MVGEQVIRRILRDGTAEQVHKRQIAAPPPSGPQKTTRARKSAIWSVAATAASALSGVMRLVMASG
jgi:hypothetical protein